MNHPRDGLSDLQVAFLVFMLLLGSMAGSVIFEVYVQ